MYPRQNWEQSEGDKHVADLINKLRDIERETNPEKGALSAKGKDLVALKALENAGDLVNAVAGWALDHQAGLALSEDPEKTKDDHKHEWDGRNWAGRHGAPIDPLVARRWLMNLVRANRGIFNLELRLMTLQALEAVAYGEIEPMLRAPTKNRKVNWTILRLQLWALAFVKNREARGLKKAKALEEVADAFRVSKNTIRSWGRRVPAELGRDQVAPVLAIAEQAGFIGASQSYGREQLHDYAQKYKATLKAKKLKA